MLFVPLITAAVLLIVAFFALKQNSRRPTNQILAAVCFVAVVTLVLQFVARIYGERYWNDHFSNPLPWVRMRLSLIGLLCPLMVWACYYVISGQYSGRKNLTLKLIPWAGISLFLMVIPFTESFKPSASRPDNILNGPLFTVYLVVIAACLLAVCIASMAVARRLTGIRQLEFRFITIAFGYLSLAAILATLVNALFPSLPYAGGIAPTLSFLVFLAFGVSAWSVTSRRVYQSSQVLVSLTERFVVAAIVAFPSVYIIRWLPTFDRSAWATAGVIAITCATYYYIDDKARGWLHLKTEQRMSAVANQLRSAATNEANPESLIVSFETILNRFIDGAQVRILPLEEDAYARGKVFLSLLDISRTSLFEEGWISVVSLARTGHRDKPDNLCSRLEEEKIHLLVSPHWSESEPGLIVAFDERENSAPFTYPEIKTLRYLTEIMDGLYTRCRFALQARQADQLAMIGLIGAGLAHELRNPIVSIDTFAQLLPSRLNDTQFLKDFAEVIPGEARRIQALAEQLLDLSRPRQYEFVPVDLHEVIAETIVLLKKKASDAEVNIDLETVATQHHITADPQALRQVLLNLILNAIRSIAGLGRPGSVTVRTVDSPRSISIEIADTGPGISDAIRSRLFRPFASAGKQHGLGLGLAICSEIAKVHQGTISAENRSEGGAVFRVTLPVG